MPLPSSAPVELLPDPDVAAAALLARSDDPRLAAVLAGILADGGAEHPFDGFVTSAADRLDVHGAELGEAVSWVGASGSDPGAAPFVGRVVGAAERLARLTTRLTEYAEACAPMGVEEVDPAVLVEGARRRMAADGWPVPAQVTVSGPPLPLDPAGAELALRHLLANAATYAAGPVRVVARRDRSGWELTVTDRGPGIPTADRARVLQPLVRLDRDRAVPGDGLGLAVVARVARGHRGLVFVNRASSTGGTTLRLVGGLR